MLRYIPCSASGAGSAWARAKRSASDAKQRSAASATRASLCCSSAERDDTASPTRSSPGSILPHTLYNILYYLFCTSLSCGKQPYSVDGAEWLFN